MAPEEKSNRSSALTSEQLGESNVAMVKSMQEMVAAAVAAAMAGLAPILKEVALTPEKLQEIKKPFVDPARVARDLRERLRFKRDTEETLKKTRQMQEYCSHRYPGGLPAVCLNNNFLDRQTRGFCMLCHDVIYPRHWTIGAPDEKNPDGKAELLGPHKDYRLVIEIANSKRMG